MVVLDSQCPVSSGPEAEAYAICPGWLARWHTHSDQTFLLQMAESVQSFWQVVSHIHLSSLVAAAVAVLSQIQMVLCSSCKL